MDIKVGDWVLWGARTSVLWGARTSEYYGGGIWLRIAKTRIPGARATLLEDHEGDLIDLDDVDEICKFVSI